MRTANTADVFHPRGGRCAEAPVVYVLGAPWPRAATAHFTRGG
jgi:hypothetical protein